MRSRHLGMSMVVALAGVDALSFSPPHARLSHKEPPRVDDEKMSRQRKRWLQKQARKTQRRHK